MKELVEAIKNKAVREQEIKALIVISPLGDTLWVKVSDVLAEVADFQKNHVIVSLDKLKEKYRKLCKTRIQDISDDAVCFFIEELTGLEPEELLEG